MPRVDLIVESVIAQSVRVRQLEGLFDVPPEQKSRRAWSFDAPIESAAWNVGLIVGPSGSGKTVIARQLFGAALDRVVVWKADEAVIDGFARGHSLSDIADVCQAVGFNTIPAWRRPFCVLSNGEQFRVVLARRLLERADNITVVDEFTSVVDRQVAQIVSNAAQKYARKVDMRFVAVSCHHDIIEWLQPDWIIYPAEERFERRDRGSLRRPRIDVSLAPVPWETWRLFAPFHYLTAELHASARCFCLFVGDEPVVFAGMRPQPVSNGNAAGTAIWALSRLVTLPDYQGLGLAFVLTDRLAAMYKVRGHRFRAYPAHPALVRSFQRSALWSQSKQAGKINRKGTGDSLTFRTRMGQRPCATFEYIGPPGDETEAARVFRYFEDASLIKRVGKRRNH